MRERSRRVRRSVNYSGKNARSGVSEALLGWKRGKGSGEESGERKEREFRERRRRAK